MNETQKSLLDSQLHQNRPAEIRGTCYLGDRSRPAENVDVSIYQLPDMKVVRRVATDAQGKFRSGFLPTGEYLILVPLIGKGNPLFPFSSEESNIATNGPVYRLQTAPMTVYPGMRAPEVELDVQMIDAGQLSFELAGEVPNQLTQTVSDADYRIELLVFCNAEPGMPALPIDPLKSATAHSWPLVGVYRHGLAAFYRGVSQFGDQPLLYNDWAPLPAKKYSLSVAFQANTASLPNAFGRGFGGYGFSAMSPAAKPATEVQVKPGERTHLRIAPPEGLETTYRKLLSEYVEAFRNGDTELQAQSLQKLQQPQPAKLEVVGYFPLESKQDASVVPANSGGFGGGLGGVGGGAFDGSGTHSAFGNSGQ
jgi:hypothetical protein